MAERIKIMAPTRSFDMTKLQIQAGADEVYLGLTNDKYVTFSFNGRFQVMNSVSVQVDGYEDLEDIVAECGKNNVKVSFTANAHYIAPALEDEYLEYIKKGIEAGADYLIVSNMGLIKLIRKKGITIPIVAGTFMVIPNAEHIKMLRDLGVQRVVLPHAATLEELKSLTKIDGMEIEVFCFMGGGNNCGRCMLLHSPVISDISAGCRAAYSVEAGREKKEREFFLDAAADCALCSIPGLIEAGVNVLKIVGRESPNPTVNSKIVGLFKRFVDGYYAGETTAQIRQELSETEMLWNVMWTPRFCDNQRCKFQKTMVVKSYI